MSMLTLFAPFSFGEKVIIDGDVSLVGTITAFKFRKSFLLCEVSYFNNGKSECAEIEDWRLTAVPG